MADPRRYPMVSCGGCLARRRTIALWYLPRSGVPIRHLGLPEGWGVRQGAPLCSVCIAAGVRRLGAGRTH